MNQKPSTKNGSVALVVGGSRGIGRQTAKQLLRRGIETILLSRDASRLERAKTDLEANGFHPLGSNVQARDVTSAILFLASGQSRWITGVVVDGVIF